VDDLGEVIGGLFVGIFELFGELLGGLLGEVLAPLFQLWFSSVWSFITGSSFLGAIGYGIYLLVH
jgi:hypothetical protein